MSGLVHCGLGNKKKDLIERREKQMDLKVLRSPIYHKVERIFWLLTIGKTIFDFVNVMRIVQEIIQVTIKMNELQIQRSNWTKLNEIQFPWHHMLCFTFDRIFCANWNLPVYKSFNPTDWLHYNHKGKIYFRKFWSELIKRLKI